MDVVARGRVGEEIGVEGSADSVEEMDEEEVREGVDRMDDIEENQEFGRVLLVAASVCEELVEAVEGSGLGAKVSAEAREREQAGHSALVFLLGTATTFGLVVGEVEGEVLSSHRLTSLFNSSSNNWI